MTRHTEKEEKQYKRDNMYNVQAASLVEEL